MTDYWKSGERHYCTFCKCWLAGNKISINLHESGNHHKSMVKAKLEQLRKTNLEKERQDKKMNETLGQMERAANESFRRDMVTNATNSLNNSSTAADANLPSKLKRPINQPVQIQCKKAKFVIKTPTPKPVFEPIATPSESDKDTETKVPQEEEEEEKPTISNNNPEGTWYEAKTETQESYYWNDTTGESIWTAPAVYLSIEQQKAKGLKV
jgi:WW domain-binding protein 4